MMYLDGEYLRNTFKTRILKGKDVLVTSETAYCAGMAEPQHPPALLGTGRGEPVRL
jgi:hypothetical protein